MSLSLPHPALTRVLSHVLPAPPYFLKQLREIPVEPGRKWISPLSEIARECVHSEATNEGLLGRAIVFLVFQRATEGASSRIIVG